MAGRVFPFVPNRVLRVPLVVRLAGTYVEEGRLISAECGLSIILADTLAGAAQKGVAASRSGEIQ
jgi:succinyl-CoA synthetase beta subunit